MDYKDIKAVNYSLLSALCSSPREAKLMLDGENKSSSGFELGNIVDHLLTDDSPITSKFIISEVKVSDAVKQWATEFYKLELQNPSLDSYNANILAARTMVGYDSRLKNDTAIQRFMTEGGMQYANALIQANQENKSIISAESLEYAENLAISVQYEPTTSKYLNASNWTKQFKQLELFAEVFGIECKGKLDIVDIDEGIKTVYIVDVKTYSSNFLSNFWKYHYYLQTPFYGELFKASYPEYKDYEYVYINVAIDTSGANKPEVYELSMPLVDYVLKNLDDNYANLNEIVDKYKRIKTIPDLIADLKWHISNDKWDHDFSYYCMGTKYIE